MAHLFRFIGEAESGKLWRLSEEEAFHINKVLRLDVGTAVEVTDGRGAWAQGVLTSSTSKQALVETAETHHDPPPGLRLELGIGALKPGAVDEILPMLCELGIDHFHVFGQHGVAKARLATKVIERWQRILVQSVKQCKRSWLPQLQEHESVVAFAGNVGDGCQRLLLRGAGDPPLSRVLAQASAARIVVAVGGEKGFDPEEELTLSSYGFEAASLGPFVLRAVTAAIAAAATLSLHREEL